MERPIKFFAGNNTKSLAGKIANAFGVELNKSSIIEFSDGECPICHTKDVTVDPEYQIEHIKQELKKIESEKISIIFDNNFIWLGFILFACIYIINCIR